MTGPWSSVAVSRNRLAAFSLSMPVTPVPPEVNCVQTAPALAILRHQRAILVRSRAVWESRLCCTALDFRAKGARAADHVLKLVRRA